MESQRDSWSTGQWNGLENWPTLLDHVHNAPTETGDHQPDFEGMESTLAMSGAFDDTVGVARNGASATHPTAFARIEPGELAPVHIMGTSTAPNPDEGQSRYQEGPLPAMEPPLAATFSHQQAQPFLHAAASAPVNAQHRDDQLVDLLFPIIDNLYGSGALMAQMVEDEEIGEMQRQHYGRAERLAPFIIGPNGEPVSYHRLRTRDPYLIVTVARLRERHLQMAHDLVIVQSTDQMIRNLVEYRESAMRRMRDVDGDYAAIVDDLTSFVQSRPTVEGSGWFNNVPR